MLPKKYKLKKNNEFKSVFKQGGFYQEDFIKIRILRNNLAKSRFGVIVGSRISKKATERNKIKRRLEEIIRLVLSRIKSNFDIVVFPEKEIRDKDYQVIEKKLIDLFKKAKLIIANK